MRLSKLQKTFLRKGFPQTRTEIVNAIDDCVAL